MCIRYYSVALAPELPPFAAEEIRRALWSWQKVSEVAVLDETDRVLASRAEVERLRGAVEREVNAKSPDVVDTYGLCPGCKKWGTNRPEGDDHEDGCPILAATNRWRDWKGRILAALAAPPAPDAAEPKGGG